MFVKNRYVAKDTWYDDKRQGVPAGIHYYVGGQTKFYGAALYRLRREDFGELQHHDGDLARVAHLVRRARAVLLAGRAAVRGPRRRTARTRPSRRPSTDYPFPAVIHEPRIQQLSDDLERAGYHPFHAPCGVRLHETNMPFSPCIRCATCDGFPSLVQGKSDAEIFGVRPALEHPNVTLLTNARVTGSRPTPRARR